MTVALAPGFSLQRVFFFRDLTFYFYPLPEIAWRMIRHGQLPLWNPYSGFGTPLAAMADVLLYYPGTWLRFLLPHPFGFNFHIIAHFYLAALSAYPLARRLEMSRAAAFAAALSFALCGPLLSLGSMLNVLVAGAWMPAAVLAALWAVESPSAWRIMVLGAAFGMQAIGGEPLFALATVVLAFAIAGSPLGRFLRAVVPAALFGMALIAVQLLPSLELLRKSVRQQQFVFSSAAAWSLDPVSLLETIVPGPLFASGSEALRHFVYGAEQPYLPSLYLGLLPVGLAMLALLRSEKREVRRTAACAAGFLAFSLGQHTAFYTLFYWLVPFVRQSRYPSKMMVAVALCLALLAGWGLDAVRQPKPLQLGWIKWALAVSAGLALRVLLAEPGTWAWAVQEISPILGRAFVMAQGVKLGATMALLALVVWLARRAPRAAPGIAILALAVDWTYTGYFVNPTAPAEIFSLRPAVVDLVGGGSREFRVDSDGQTPGRFLPVRQGWPTEALSALDMRLALAFGAPLEGVRDARNLSPNKLFTSEFYSFRLQVEEWLHRREHARLGRLNIRYFITTPAAPPPGVRQIAEAPSLTRKLVVWEIEDWRPRAEILGGTARIAAETPTRLIVEVESANGGALLLRDSYDDGWRAWVDGRPAGIERAEEIFRAVRVPAGGHTVDFAYRPWTFPVGAAISSAALLLLAVAAIGNIPSIRNWNKPAKIPPSR